MLSVPFLFFYFFCIYFTARIKKYSMLSFVQAAVLNNSSSPVEVSESKEKWEETRK
jgi:hypothetical protein